MKKNKLKLKQTFRTVGVRFLNANVNRIYTYLLAKRHKVHLGQELVVENEIGTGVVVVVRIDAGQKPSTYELKTITREVADL